MRFAPYANREKILRVAILSSEAVPFAKTGGLGDVAGALPKALRAVGVDATLVLPLYQETKHRFLQRKIIDNLEVEWGMSGVTRCGVWYSEATGSPVFLIDAPKYFARSGFYGYKDDHERFAFFGRAALTLLKRLGQPPDIVHLNDWFGGFAAVELQMRRRNDPFYRNTRTLFSIHNLAYQGAFDPAELPALGFSDSAACGSFMFGGAASALHAGLVASDMLSTVSRRYSFEIQTKEHGYGLEAVLRARAERLAGITNGIDTEVWNPATDEHLAAHFSADNLASKRLCKLDLLRRFNLPEDVDRPVVAIVSRLTSQKGFDLIKEASGAILQTGARFVALGSGAPEYENFLQLMREHAPQQVGVFAGFNEPLAHQIEAGADIFLMPSLYEPCGLNQMYSMRYGTVPVVRATGGLDDTVENFNQVTGAGNGFKFERYTAAQMLESLHEAIYCYHEPEVWRRIQLNGMRADNSWFAAARNYAQLYQATAGL